MLGGLPPGRRYKNTYSRGPSEDRLLPQTTPEGTPGGSPRAQCTATRPRSKGFTRLVFSFSSFLLPNLIPSLCFPLSPFIMDLDVFQCTRGSCYLTKPAGTVSLEKPPSGFQPVGKEVRAALQRVGPTPTALAWRPPNTEEGPEVWVQQPLGKSSLPSSGLQP